MTTSTSAAEEAPSSTDQPHPDQARTDARAATSPDLSINDADSTDHELPDQMVRAYYGFSRADLSGPAAFGTGSTVVGTLNVGLGIASGRPFVTRQIGKAAAEDATAGYVPTTTDGELLDRLRAQPLVYLSGRVGTGRFTSALAAMTHRHSAERVATIGFGLECRLDEAVSQPDLLLEEHGHILVADDRGEPTATAMTLLATHAARHRATVVVVGRTGRYDRELSRYLVPHAPPDHRRVFHCWLQTSLETAGTCIGGCPTCDGGCIPRYTQACVERVGADLAAVRELGEVVRLALLFARDRPDPSSADALMVEADSGLRAEARRLLRAEESPSGLGSRRVAQHRQAFRIAYAVLNGRSLTHVFRATGMLMDELDDAQGLPRAGRDVLQLDVDGLLGTGVRETGGPAVSGVARTAQLRHPRLADAILDVAWNEYDSVRTPLLEWIKNLAHDQDPEVRIAGAAAAGRLCAYDFDEAFTIIGVWARTATGSVRQAGALACESAAYNEHLTARVAHVVHEWVRAPGAARARDTAARIYATTFGQRFPERALEDLAIVALDPMQHQLDSVARAIDRIYEPARAATILRALGEWTTSEWPPLLAQGNRCMARLARRMVDASTQDDHNGWPELLVQLHRGLVPCDALARLWDSTLRHPATSSEAWEALGCWVSSAQGRPVVGQALQPLFEAIFTSPTMRRRLRFYLEKFWSRRMRSNDFLTTVEATLKGR